MFASITYCDSNSKNIYVSMTNYPKKQKQLDSLMLLKESI